MNLRIYETAVGYNIYTLNEVNYNLGGNDEKSTHDCPGM